MTPSLNKSFKFQSEWPYNNSQAYLLQTILKDIESDKDRIYEKKDDQYIFTTKVNYSNNNQLVKQKVIFDKDLIIKEVQILDSNDNVQMKMSFDVVDLKADYKDNHFALKDNMDVFDEKDFNSPVSKIESIIYPMYVPANTHLVSQDKVVKEDGERIIMTFGGDNSFILVQETANIENEFLTIPVYGEPYMLTDTVAAVSEDSITWSSNGIDYYVISENLTTNELLSVAKSISVMPVGK